MIIHTKEVLKNLGTNFIEEGGNILDALNGEDKIKIILRKKMMSTKEIIESFNLTPRAIRSCLLKLERKGEIKRIIKKKQNKKSSASNIWKVINKSEISENVPNGKVFVFYKREHYNRSYQSHYIFLPKEIILNEEKFTAIGIYDAEGTKSNIKSIEVVNCEPMLIGLFLMFLESLGIKKEQLSYRIIFNKRIASKLNKSAGELESDALKFWTNRLTIPKERIRKFNHTGKNIGVFRQDYADHGSLSLNYNSVLFRRLLFKIMEKSRKNLKDNSEITAYLRGYLAGEAYVGRHDREIQFACKDINHLLFIKELLNKIDIKCSVSKATSTSPPRVIITSVNEFLKLEALDIFKFIPEKRVNLLTKILNYKFIESTKRKELEKKLKMSKL